MSEPTLLSLFDGSGGFPLAAQLCGIRPVAASEVEPYCIAVTRSRFPGMKHLGNVAEIHGDEIEPVDVITFGAPCQDLSVAGKRAGLRHGDLGDEETTRSGLFMEAVRIIKEMREATNGEYPKYCIYENVPGAFSSSKGEDWRIVLEELIKIVEPGAVMPPVPKNGWPYADSYCGDGWSLAYRVLDAQFIRTAQRRRRVFLTLDLTGNRARKISFERDGLRGHFETFRTAWETPAGDASDCTGATDRARECVAYSFDSLASNSMKSSNPHSGCRWVEVAKTLDTTDPNPSKNQGGIAIVESAPVLQLVPNILLDDQGGQQINVRTDDKCPTLRAEAHGNVPAVVEQHLFENHSQDSRYRGPLDVCPMLPAQLGTGGNNQPFVVEETYSIQGNTIDRDAKQNGSGVCENVAHTLNSVDRHAAAYSIGNGQLNQISMSEVCNTLDCMHDKQAVLVHGVDCRNPTEHPELYPTLQAKPNGGQSLNYSGAVRIEYLVRRLTPTECARLQGFPDDWGHPDQKEDFTDEEYRFWLDVRNTHAAFNGKAVKDYTKPQMVKWYGKLHSDSSEYKMWGNGIALPCAVYIMQGIAEALNENT